MAVPFTTPGLFLILALGTIIYTGLWILYCRTLHPLANVPGPCWASVTRLWYMYRIYVGDSEIFQRALHQKYGPLVRIAPNEISSADPSAIPLIYRSREPLLKAPEFYGIWSSGTNISQQPDLFTVVDEKVHSQVKKVVNHVYARNNILKYEKHIHRCTQLFLQKLRKFADEKKSVELGKWIQMYTFDVIGELFFGRMFGFLEKEEDHELLIESLDAIMPITTTAAVGPKYYRPFIFGSSAFIPSIRKAVNAVSYIQKAAIEAMERRKEEDKLGIKGRNDMLGQLMDITQEKDNTGEFTENEVCLHSWASMFAGSDTTAIAIRACFYYLASRPDYQKRLQAELDGAFPLANSQIKYLDAIKLPYLSACIKEAMRLWPSISLNLPRTTPKQGLELSDTLIPGGYYVGVNAGVVQYDKETFGEDAAEFRPERWLVDEEKLKLLEKATSLLFGAGTRVCMGKYISLMEIYTVVPTVFLNLGLEMDQVGPWKTRNSLFNKQTDMNVKVTRRDRNTVNGS